MILGQIDDDVIKKENRKSKNTNSIGASSAWKSSMFNDKKS